MDENKSSRLKNRLKILKSRVEDLGKVQNLLLTSVLGYKAMTAALIISYTVGMFFVSVQLSGLRTEVSADIAELRAEVSADIAGLRSEVSELQKTAATKNDLEQLRSELSAIGPVALN